MSTWENEGEPLKKFPSEVFEMKNLTDLNLYDCFVANKRIEIPDEIGKLAKLRTFTIGIARVTSLPETLGKLTKLVDLNLESAEYLSSLPASLGKLQSLRRLELQFTHKLTALPDSVGNLAKLQRLRARPSGLKSVPATLWNAKKLLSLALPDSVKRLPVGIAKLSKLWQLELGIPAFMSIADEIASMKNLRKLSFSGSRAERLPDAIGTVTSLHELNISAMGLTELPASLANLRELRTLEVQYNSLSNLASLANALPKLETLVFSGNKLVRGEGPQLRRFR